MIFITQLIYILDGQEATFKEFESLSIPIISKYRGELLIRTRTNESTVIQNNIEIPYEIHIVKFLTESDFQNFIKDEARKSYLHLKEKSIKSSILIKGEIL